MSNTDFLARGKELHEDLISYRRQLHQNPEVGLDLPETTQFVKDTLAKYGIQAEEIAPSALSVLIEGGKPGKTILLRADMDALPMPEETGLPFSSKNEGKMHACGHDIHTTMMIAATVMLNEVKDELAGNVKIMFQPGEEIFAGAKLMVDAGILENPSVDAALDMHVHSVTPLGNLFYSKGAYTTSGDNFKIVIKGEGTHGAQPHNGTDPINVAAKIVDALQVLQAREVGPDEYLGMSITSINGGDSYNIIPDTVELKGTMRTYNPEVRDLCLKRIPEIVDYTAKSFGTSAEFEVVMGTPTIINDSDMVDDISRYLESFGMEFNTDPNLRLPASDDFGYVAEKVPSVMFSIGCKPEDAVGKNVVHNTQVKFDEDVLPVGAAVFAHSASHWLEEHQ